MTARRLPRSFVAQMTATGDGGYEMAHTTAPRGRRVRLAVLIVTAYLRGLLRWYRNSEVRRQELRRGQLLVQGTPREGQATRVARGLVTEQAVLWTLFPHYRLLTGAPVVGLDRLLAAEAAGRGVMLTTTHCGWIQALLWSLADHGLPITCVSGGWIQHSTRSNDVRQMPMVDDAIDRGTRHIVAGTGAFDQLDRVLVGRGRALMAVDMPGSLPVTYLGKRAKVGQGTFRIAWAHDAPVVPIGIRRRGLRMVVEVGEVLWPSAYDSVEDLAQAGMDAASAAALPDAEQYMPRNVDILWPGGTADNSRPNRVAWSEKQGLATS